MGSLTQDVHTVTAEVSTVYPNSVESGLGDTEKVIGIIGIKEGMHSKFLRHMLTANIGRTTIRQREGWGRGGTGLG